MIPNLTDIQCFVNGQLVPQNLIKLKVGDNNQTAPSYQVGDFNDLTVPYQQYLQMCGIVQNSTPYMRGFRDGAGCMSYEEWRSTCPIFCWNLDGIAITPFFQGRAEIVIKWTKFQPTAQVPPPPGLGEGYNMFSFVHCLKSCELQFRDHTSHILINSPSAPAGP